MRPLAFTAFPDRPVTVNPAMVSRVEVVPGTRHAVLLILADERAMCVAEFQDRNAAVKIAVRIGEHLWSDDAAALAAEERCLIERHPPTRDVGRVNDPRTVATKESQHPALVFERGRPKRSEA